MIGTLCECGKAKIVRIRSTERFQIRGVELVLDECPVGMCPSCGEKYYSAALLRRARTLAAKVGSSKTLHRIPLFRYSRRRRAAAV